MNCPSYLDLHDKIQATQQIINQYQDHIQYNKDRINYLIFVGVNRLGQRPYIEQLSLVQRLHQLYTNQLLELEQIQSDHHCYHPNTL